MTSPALFSEPPEPSTSATPTDRAITAPFAPLTAPAAGEADSGPADAPADRDAPGNPAWSSPSTDATGDLDAANPRARRRSGPPTPRRTHR